MGRGPDERKSPAMSSSDQHSRVPPGSDRPLASGLDRSGLERRGFLKLGGVAAGVALLEGCGRRETVLIEQTLKRSSVPPGSAAWRRSICQQCSGGCEVEVRVIDGRAKKIEGVADSPVNAGGVCALGHSALQELYHPQRITTPQRWTPASRFEASTWEESLTKVGVLLASARARSPLSVALCCSPDPVASFMTRRVAARLGASVTVVEATHAALERAARERRYGVGADIAYDLSEADLVVCAGASILDRWGNPVYFAGAVAQARARGAPLVSVSPRMSLTSARADQWLPVRPGTTATLLRALAVALQSSIGAVTKHAELDGEARDTATGSAFAGSAATGRAATPEESDGTDSSAGLDHAALWEVADLCAVPRARVEGLLGKIREARRPVIIVGGEDARTSEDVDAGFALQEACGSVREIRQDPFHSCADSTSTPPTERSLGDLASAIRERTVSVVVCVETDLVGRLPSSWLGSSAFEEVSLISLASVPNDTVERSAWVLPVQTDLERHQLGFPLHSREIILTVAEPVLEARGQARNSIDVLLALAETQETAPLSATESESATQSSTTADWADFEEVRAALVEELTGEGTSGLRGALRSDGRLLLVSGKSKGADNGLGSLSAPKLHGALETSGAVAASAGPEISEAVVGSGRETLDLMLFEGSRGEMTGGRRPWMAELPDPLSSMMWGSWIEMASVDAARLGLVTGEVVSVRSEAGAIVTTVMVSPAMRPGTAAMPMGVKTAWPVNREAAGRASTPDHGQPIDLLPPPSARGVEAGSGVPSQRVQVTIESSPESLPGTAGKAAIYGRGLRQPEHIPRGWRGHQPKQSKAQPSSEAAPPVDPVRQEASDPAGAPSSSAGGEPNIRVEESS